MNKIASEGIVELDDSMTKLTESLIENYYSSYRHPSFDFVDVRDKFRLAIANARAMKHLKKNNAKEEILRPVKESLKAINILIENLPNIDGHALSVLNEAINEEFEYLGYSSLKHFKELGEYVESTLKPFQNKLQITYDSINSSPPLKVKLWQEQLIEQLLDIHIEFTDSIPLNIGSGGNSAAPEFYSLVNDISLNELSEGISELKIRRHLQLMEN